MKKFSLRAAGATLALGLAAAGVSPATAATTTATTTAPVTAPAHDLAPSFTVSGMKAPGFAGLVGIHVKNVGSQRYFADFPAISFKVEVKTDHGPTGVDRLITPGWFNGAYTQDLGYNEVTGTRTFMVTLSNPVEVGKDVLIANLNFGDGLTSEGRIYNYVTVTQVGRLADDKSTGNDQNIDSRKATRLDTGGTSKGIF